MYERKPSDKEINKQKKDLNNSEENSRNIISKKINLDSEKTIIISEEKEKRFECNNDIIIKKIYYDKMKYQDRKKTNLNNLTKIQLYYIIKSKKIYSLINVMVSLINIYFLICENNKENILSKLSEVKLKIKEKGNIKLFFR